MTDKETSIVVSLSEQRLECSIRNERLSYSVSTATNGSGQKRDSGCTPLGQHQIVEKIGYGVPVDTVFIGREATGELYSENLASESPGRDWILTRIIWLTGIEDGYNKGGLIDTKSRFIYIHGSPDSTPMGAAGSAGCIRMRNDDVIEVFDLVMVGTKVTISE